MVTNAAFGDMKRRLIRSLADHKNPPPDTNVVASATNSITATTTNMVEAATNSAPAPAVVVTNAMAVAISNPAAVTNAAVVETNLLILPPPIRVQKLP